MAGTLLKPEEVPADVMAELFANAPQPQQPQQPEVPADVMAELFGNAGASVPEPVQRPAPKPNVSATESFIRGASDAASMGFLDEMGGFGAWLNTVVNGETPRTTGRGMGAPLSDRSSYEVERDSVRQAQHDAEEANPMAFMGGQAAGTVLTAAAPMGAAKVAPRMMAPVTKLMAPAATIGQRAKQAAILGGASGAVNAAGASEADTMGGVAKDTALGAGLGAGLGVGGGELVHQIATRGQPMLAAAKRLLGEHAEEFLQKMDAGYGPALAKRGRGLASNNEVAQRRRALALRGADDGVIEAHSNEITDKISTIAKNLDAITADETIAKKAKVARKYFEQDGIDPETAAEAADAIAKETRQAVQEMFPRVKEGTDEYRLLGRIAKQIEEYDLMPLDSATSTPYEIAADKWARVDQIKREFQKNLRNVKFRSREVDALHGIENQLVAELENPLLWGQGAADLQVRRNRAWYNMLKLEQTKDLNPRSEFMSDYKGTPSAAEESYRSLAEGDIRGVLSTLKKAGTIEGEPSIWKLREVMKRRADLAEALVDHIDPNPNMVAKAREARKLANEIDQIVGARNAEAKAAREVEMIAAADPQAASLASKVVRGVSGQLPAPLTGAAAGYLGSDEKESFGGKLANAAEGALYGVGLRQAGRMIPKKLRPGPGTGALIEDMVSGTPRLGERIKEIARLEDTLRQTPGNKVASQRLEDLRGLEAQLDRILKGKNTQPINVGSRGAAAEQYARVASGYAAGQTVATEQPRSMTELALDDPEYGSVLASRNEDDRAVAYSALMQTDPGFRQRMKRRAEELAEDEEEEPTYDEEELETYE